MKCPVCGRPTRVLAVEHLANGCTRVRRVCTIPTRAAHGEDEFDTYEVPAAFVAAMGRARFEKLARSVQRGVTARQTARARREAVRRLDWARASHIAAHLGITEARVRQIRSELDA